MPNVLENISSNLEVLRSPGHEIIILSDIDGTIMSHSDYDTGWFMDTMDILKYHNIVVIPVTSKTLLELEMSQSIFRFQGPRIAENGGVISISDHAHDIDCHHETIIKVLSELPKSLISQMKCLSKLSIQEIQEITNLPYAQAESARTRLASETFTWTGTVDCEKRLILHLREHNLRLVKGGRFYHVIGLRDKAQASKKLIEFMYGKKPNSSFEVWALGDAENDFSLLKLADKRAIIKNTKIDQSYLVKNLKSAYFSKQEAPFGWAESIEKLTRKKWETNIG